MVARAAPRRNIPARPGTSGVSAVWVPPGATVEVAGHTISGGFIYFGEGLVAPNGWNTEPALVNPTLFVDWTNPDWSGQTLGYWSKYDQIDPRARAAYLSWLGNGRNAPTTNIGYVFLYYYGLERRLLVDLAGDLTGLEAQMTRAEIERLLGIYGDNRSFAGYSSSLLEYLDAHAGRTAALTVPDWTTLPRTRDVPVTVRLALARYVAAGYPIPADWALAFLRTAPNSYVGNQATRVPSEFDALFKQRYTKAFGAGMVVKPNKACVEVSYQAASGSGISATYEFEGLPDITKINTPINKLKAIGEACCESLAPYARYMGRASSTPGSPEAASYLPDELLSTFGGEAFAEAERWAAEVVLEAPAVIDISEVVERWAPGRTDKLTKKDATLLALLMSRLGLGIEPDPRFGGKTPPPGSKVVLFALADAAPSAPSSEYAAACLLVHLAAVVAGADGAVSEAERDHLTQHLEANLGLDESERVRLDAHLRWLTAAGPTSTTGMKRRLDALDEVTRTAIGEFLVSVAAADGNVSPSEITTLTKLYKLLGLDQSAVFSAVHQAGLDTGPVTVRLGAQNEPRWQVPQPERSAGPVDRDKVRVKLAETASVAALLSDIFTDDDTSDTAPPLSPPSVDAPPPPPTDAPVQQWAPPPVTTPSAPNSPSPVSPPAAVDELIPGLDDLHDTLARRLVAQPSWSRADAEAVAAEIGLPLLDSALDRINEASMDACGDLMFEGDDPIDINTYALQEFQ